MAVVDETSSDRLKRLYPAVNQEETPLPSCWSRKRKFVFVEVFHNDLRVRFAGQGHDHTYRDASSVQANHPIPAACGLYYFEVKIVSEGRHRYMGIGLTPEGSHMNRLPGWDIDTYGYHADDGHSFASSGSGRPYGPTFTTGDVIGCGVNFLDGRGFYTKNGEDLGFAIWNVPPVVYPTVGLMSPGEIVEGNFGQEPFVFDIEAKMRSQVDAH